MTTFAERYVLVPFESRHLYEIIRESYPCRLYFDLEFSLTENPALDGEALTKKWVHLVLWKLYEYFSLLVSFHDVIDLDSSTETKFSRHITIIIKDSIRGSISHSSSSSDEILFLNNIEVGAFVFAVINDILIDNGQSTQPRRGFEDLWVQKDGKRETCFVDLGVYTKNRAFRLFSSSKYGKKTALKIACQVRIPHHSYYLPSDKKFMSKFIAE
jgi:hypothetical protein